MLAALWTHDVMWTGAAGAGESADVAFVAKDAAGVQKSLGGDVFTVSWERAGQDDATPPTSGMLPDGTAP